MLPDNVDQVKRIVPPFTGSSKLAGGGNSEGFEGNSMAGIFADLCPGGVGIVSYFLGDF